MLEDDCRYLMVRYLRRYIFESSDGENKRTPRGLLKAFQCKPEGLELLDVAQCCYNLTTKELRVERPFELATGQQPPPHTIAKRGGLPISLLCQEVVGSQRPSPNPLKLKAWPGLKEEESRPCRAADRRGSLQTQAISSVKTHPVFHVSQLTSIRPDRPREERAHEGTTRCCR